jgi:hypothetical protein
VPLPHRQHQDLATLLAPEGHGAISVTDMLQAVQQLAAARGASGRAGSQDAPLPAELVRVRNALRDHQPEAGRVFAVCDDDNDGWATLEEAGEVVRR